MYFYTLEDATDYLTNRGGYKIAGQLARENYPSFQSYERRILLMADRVSACMEKYPKEIYDFLKKHPEKGSYTLEVLESMTYVELSALRKELGIRNRKSKKKVTQVEPASILAEQGRKRFGSVSDNTAAKTVALFHLQESIKEEKENPETVHEMEQILSEQEIICMYGEDLPSLEFLAQHGIYPENLEEYKKRLKF